MKFWQFRSRCIFNAKSERCSTNKTFFFSFQLVFNLSFDFSLGEPLKRTKIQLSIVWAMNDLCSLDFFVFVIVNRETPCGFSSFWCRWPDRSGGKTAMAAISKTLNFFLCSSMHLWRIQMQKWTMHRTFPQMRPLQRLSWWRRRVRLQ